MKFTIPILMYHQVSTEAPPNFSDHTVRTDVFKSQMKILKFLGFQPITFDQLYEYTEKKNSLPSKPVIITFDDVFQDAIENAVPILESSGFNAVFYVPTNFVGKKSSWMLPDVNTEFQIADWSTIKDLDSRGFEIGSHTMSHPEMDAISKEDCYRELVESRKILEETLGHEVRHLAYPFGCYDDNVRTLTHEAGYYTACTVVPLIANSSHDLFELPRINVGREESLSDFVLQIYTAHTYKEHYRNKKTTLIRTIPKPVRRFIKKLINDWESH